MSKTVSTKKGSQLPLMSLKGKDYLQVAYRLQWLSDDAPKYSVETQFLTLTEESATCKATVITLDDAGNIIRRATATKQETKESFGDFIEKAETGAIGRALAILGFGTQHALADLDEGERIVDSPLTKGEAVAAPAPVKTETTERTGSSVTSTTSTSKKPSPFKSRLQRNRVGA